MDLREYRAERGVTLNDLSEILGLSADSPGHLSRLERGIDPWPIRTALKVELWSEGRVRAVDILSAEDAQLLREVIELSRIPQAALA